MLPIWAWRIYYADGSTFSSEDGTFAQAPPFGVQCVVYYRVDDKDRLLRWTDDGGGEENDVFVYHGEGEDEGWKMGMWMDAEGLHRIHDLASQSTMPKPSQ